MNLYKEVSLTFQKRRARAKAVEMRRGEKTNPRIVRLIADLKRIAREGGSPLWRDIAERLEKPSRHYAEVNLSKINRYTQANDTIVVPGKVLSSGMLEKPVTVAALAFSKKAYDKISSCGKCVSIEDLMATNPKGSGIKVIA